MKEPRRPRIRSGEIIILIVIGLLILVFFTGNVETILKRLYSPYAGFVALVMLIEYLLLRGGDRTALYRRELEAARARRRDELLATRELETQLVEMRTRVAQLLEHEPLDAQASRAMLEQIQGHIEGMLNTVRHRV